MITSRARTRLLALALVLLVTLPGPALAAPSEHKMVPFPDALAQLARERLDAMLEEEPKHVGRGWHDTPDAKRLLAAATENATAGNYRNALDLMSARDTLLAGGEFNDTLANKSVQLRSAEFVRHLEAERAVTVNIIRAFRTELRDYEKNMSSLKAFELTFYAALLAADAQVRLANYPVFRDSLKGDQFTDGHIFTGLGLVRGPRFMVNESFRLLEHARSIDGVGERYDRTSFVDFVHNVTAQADPENAAPGGPREYDRIILGTRNTGEQVLAVASYLGFIRAQRQLDVVAQFADAESRGVGVLKILENNIARNLANTSVQAYVDRGYTGLLAYEAINDAVEALESPYFQLENHVSAWMGLEINMRALAWFAVFSPVTPPTPATSTTATPTPAPGLLVAAVAVAVAVGLTRRRRAA